MERGGTLSDRHGLATGLMCERELIEPVGRRLCKEGHATTPDDVLALRRSDLELLAHVEGARYGHSGWSASRLGRDGRHPTAARMNADYSPSKRYWMVARNRPSGAAKSLYSLGSSYDATISSTD